MNLNLPPGPQLRRIGESLGLSENLLVVPRCPVQRETIVETQPLKFQAAGASPLKRYDPAQYAPIADTLVIGVGHKSRHGKDTAAGIIASAYPNIDIQRFGFADALKAICRVEHGMTTKDGALLQKAGVSRRAADLDVWVRALYWTIVERKPAVALITDMRFLNEVGMVKAMGGYTMKVSRVHSDGSPYVSGDRDRKHISETELDSYEDWDAVIENPDGDLGAFSDRVLDAFRQLTAGYDAGDEMVVL